MRRFPPARSPFGDLNRMRTRVKAEDRNVAALRRELLAAQDRVSEFEALMDDQGVREPTRFILRQWVEGAIMGPILDRRERILRGIQRRN